MSVMLSGSIFQSTLPGWGATGDGNQPTVATAISIHAPRVGSDAGHPVPARLDGRISIHAPRMGSDNEQEVAKTEAETFQSTLPGWGATRIGGFDGSVFKFQSTLPGWGATLVRPVSGLLTVDFNPRSPDGERPFKPVGPKYGGYISIHAPRMGSDATIRQAAIIRAYFNPRSPDGERRKRGTEGGQGTTISIHAPRMGSDRRLSTGALSRRHFNPRSPDGERQPTSRIKAPTRNFNPRSPDGERPGRPLGIRQVSGYFNPRSPDGERP